MGKNVCVLFGIRARTSIGCTIAHARVQVRSVLSGVSMKRCILKGFGAFILCFYYRELLRMRPRECARIDVTSTFVRLVFNVFVLVTECGCSVNLLR